MIKLILIGMCVLAAAGCNVPTDMTPATAPTLAWVSPVSATIPPTFTPLPTFTPTATPDVQPELTNASPSPVETVLVIPSTQPGVTTREANSFQGSVLLQGGACCIGGIVGAQVDLHKEFQAQSPWGQVVEMRRLEGMHCFSEDEMTGAAWEPFTPSVTETFVITAINWVGHYLSVQFRDSQGNLSRVVCDDISVEGLPAPPTPE